MYILSGKNGRFNSSSRTLFGDRAKRVYVLLVYCCSLFANGRMPTAVGLVPMYFVWGSKSYTASTRLYPYFSLGPNLHLDKKRRRRL